MTPQHPGPPPPTGSPPPPPSPPSPPSDAQLLALVWDALSDVLGVPATATLLRRSLKRAAAREPAAALVQVLRDGFDYRPVTPDGWSQGSTPEGRAALRALFAELYPLLRELTGPLLVRKLEQLPALQQSGLTPQEAP